MATIRAKGQTEFGERDVTITGAEKVENISASRKSFAEFVKEGIRLGEGSLANGVYPEPNTMLQAFAVCRMLFREQDITVDGDIGEIEYEDGVIY